MGERTCPNLYAICKRQRKYDNISLKAKGLKDLYHANNPKKVAMLVSAILDFGAKKVTRDRGTLYNGKKG